MGASKLGMRVRKYREERDLSREDLAKATGLDIKILEELEEANVYPSLAPLQKITRAMNVRLGTFMDDVQVKDPLIVRLKSQGTDLAMQNAKGKKPAFLYHSLGKGKADRNMEPFFIEMSKEPSEERAISSHQGEEFIVVTKGRVLLLYGKDEHILEEGDSVYYNSIVPHYLGAADDAGAEIYAVVYYP